MKAKKKSAKQETAKARYGIHRMRILVLLKKIEEGLEKDQAAFKGPEGLYEKNWGFVGSLAEWADRLQEISDAINQEGEHAPENRA